MRRSSKRDGKESKCIISKKGRCFKNSVITCVIQEWTESEYVTHLLEDNVSICKDGSEHRREKHIEKSRVKKHKIVFFISLSLERRQWAVFGEGWAAEEDNLFRNMHQYVYWKYSVRKNKVNYKYYLKQCSLQYICP